MVTTLDDTKLHFEGDRWEQTGASCNGKEYNYQPVAPQIQQPLESFILLQMGSFNRNVQILSRMSLIISFVGQCVFNPYIIGFLFTTVAGMKYRYKYKSKYTKEAS